MAGFRRTRMASQCRNTPLFNFTKPHPLGRLTQKESIEMISRPLRLLGLDLRPSDLPTTIYKETGGQPELLQIFGSEIVNLLEAKEEIPAAGELLSHVLGSKLFREKVLGSFLINTTPYEELMCYLLIAAIQGQPIPQFEFGFETINSLLKKCGFHLSMAELRGLTNNLETAGVIEPVAGVVEKFIFSVPQLARYCMNMDLDVCTETALVRVQTAPDRETALWGDLHPDHSLGEID
jgi:hypothetical protein